MATDNTTTEKTTQGRRLRGTVVASKMQDTCTVIVDRYVKNPKYKKYQKRSKKFLVHDRGNTAAVGDNVVIEECRPISKRKSFVLVVTEAKS